MKLTVNVLIGGEWLRLRLSGRYDADTETDIRRQFRDSLRTNAVKQFRTYPHGEEIWIRMTSIDAFIFR